MTALVWWGVIFALYAAGSALHKRGKARGLLAGAEAGAAGLLVFLVVGATIMLAVGIVWTIVAVIIS